MTASDSRTGRTGGCRRIGWWGLAAAFLSVAVVLVAAAPRSDARQRGGRIAAASEAEAATQAALRQMRAGGNAVDAAVTAALVAGVVRPVSSGIGGGGFALVWDAAARKPLVLDFRESAPAGIDVDAFERRPLPPPERGQLIGVPGEVAGLFELHRRYGKLSWQAVVRPAVEAAERGFTVGDHMVRVIAWLGARLEVEPDLAALFLPGGKPVASGARVKNPKLGRTLARIAAEGPKAFYDGPVAADLASAARRTGGALSIGDLAAYRPVERRPVSLKWEGHDVYTMPPPSAGGVMLAQTLGMYSSAELRRLGFNTGAYIHMVAESLRGALADRMRHIGDPDHTQVDVNALLSPSRLAARRRSIALDRTHAIPRFGLEEEGTHHLVTADAEGNVVSLTTTVNRAFGAKVMGRESYVVLNDELNDFTAKQDVAPFGMTESPNRPRPGARPVSSMTPTLVVKDGEVVLALGGSGGMRIGPNVTQVALSRLVFGHSPEQALAAPRFTIPTEGAFIAVHADAPESLVRDLERRGEIVTRSRFDLSAVQMIAIENGRKIAAADPRKHGSARAE